MSSGNISLDCKLDEDYNMYCNVGYEDDFVSMSIVELPTLFYLILFKLKGQMSKSFPMWKSSTTSLSQLLTSLNNLKFEMYPF